MKLSTVILFAKDMARLRKFYADGVGLGEPDQDSPPHWIRFPAGGASFALHGIPDEVGVTVEDPPRTREDSAWKLVFHADDVEAARGRLLEHGARMGEVRRSQHRVSCDGADPEGNVFQIADD